MKLDVQYQEGGRILDVNGQGRLGVLKIGQFSWTLYVYHLLESLLTKHMEKLLHVQS